MAKIFTDELDESKPKINSGSIEEFFEKRAKKVDILGYDRAVIYQDKNPSLAVNRDIAEKRKLLPMLKLGSRDRVLDIGCGTGRWVESIIERAGNYHGIDFSEGLLSIARNRFIGKNNIRFTQLRCSNLSVERLGGANRFTKVICFGVLMYLNDEDIRGVLSGVAEVADEQCVFLLREPIGIAKRLTIIEHYSEEMGQIYNAIYRTEDELLNMCGESLNRHGFVLDGCGDVYADQKLNNRLETKQRWFLYRR